MEQWCKGNGNTLRDLGNLFNIDQVKEIEEGETELVVMMEEEKLEHSNEDVLLPLAMLLLGEGGSEKFHLKKFGRD